MQYKSKLNRNYEIGNGKLYDVNGWAIVVCHNIEGQDIQNLIDEWEGGKIAHAYMAELKDYENNYSYKDGQIGLTAIDSDETTSFLVSGKSLRNGSEYWDYEIYDYVKDSDIFISDMTQDKTVYYVINSESDIMRFLNGRKSELTVYDRPIDYYN